MKNLESLKARSQESLTHLVDLGKQQPEQVQYWGVTVAAALGGALALAAVAKGVLGIVGTLAYPPVALTVGALSGGVLGWSFMQQRPEQSPSAVDTMTEDAAAPLEADVVILTDTESNAI